MEILYVVIVSVIAGWAARGAYLKYRLKRVVKRASADLGGLFDDLNNLLDSFDFDDKKKRGER